MSEIRIGLIGCGVISEDHVRAYVKQRARCRVAACFDIEPERAHARAAQAQAECRVATSVQDIIDDPEIDAVDLCTPPHLHPDTVIAAAAAGKHISCQKPLARTIAECDAMIDAAQRAGVVLFHAEFNRTAPAALKARQMLDSGRVGVPVGVQATFAFWQGGKLLASSWRYDPEVAGGGQLLDSGIHAIDLVRHIGGEVSAVTCATTRFRPELGGEDTATVGFRFVQGHLGNLYSTQACGLWTPTPSFVLYGTEGIITIGGPHGALALHRLDLPDRIEVVMRERGGIFDSMIDAFLSTVEGSAPNPSPGEEGRENLRVVLAAYEASRLGREIALSDFPAHSASDSGGAASTHAPRPASLEVL